MSLETGWQTAALREENKPANPAHVGRVRLAVSDLGRSVQFYSRVIGLAELGRGVSEGGHPVARLGAPDGRELLVLEAMPGVQPVGDRAWNRSADGTKRLGLYHTAFLLPSRLHLALFVEDLRRLGVGFAGGEHFVSEAIYLVDPDGLEVEVYADRPREQWPWVNGQLRMGTAGVRYGELAALAADSGQTWQGAPVGTTVGHVHLYVRDLQEAAAFYLDGLGMEVMVGIPTALFVSYDGYHHHVGLNVWAADSPVAGATDARLTEWELVLSDEAERDAIAERLSAGGYGGEAGVFTDDVGIPVRLVAGADGILAAERAPEPDF
jgi:catechol 2,3-dioxygenase